MNILDEHQKWMCTPFRGFVLHSFRVAVLSVDDVHGRCVLISNSIPRSSYGI